MELKSRHTWRGGLTTRSWNVQPTIEYKPIQQLTLGAWGCYAVDNDYAEVDLYISYSVGQLAITVYDYFNPIPSENARNHHFFDFDKKTTGHQVDVAAKYTLSSIPLTLMASTIVYGCDLNENANNRFSTYLEAAYEHTIKSGQHLKYFIGGTTHEGMYYGNANIVNVGLSVTQPIRLSSVYEVPVTGSLIVNPARGNIYLVIGATLF